MEENEALEYHVVRGDTFWGLAERFYGNGSLYPIIQEYNGITSLRAGTVIYIPPPELMGYSSSGRQSNRQQPAYSSSSSNHHQNMNINWNNFRMQIMLNGLGFDTRGIDGVIGPKTQAAISGFQKAYGLYASGQADQETINTMHHSFMNDAIYLTGHVIQALLLNAGYSPGKIDGVVGRNTQAAIINYQRNHGLYASGQVDDDTLMQLKRDLYPNDAY